MLAAIKKKNRLGDYRIQEIIKLREVIPHIGKLNILSKSRYNVDLILVVYYISGGQTSLLQVTMRVYVELLLCTYIYIVNGC